ncbi:MAG: autotransporter outer membrane beta-barrel domain-containing protein [Desulfuromonadales bacterium]|nr:autotransporter outer membrane beta-barrel domain-containing protein [Desulfuromonadales bacterium]
MNGTIDLGGTTSIATGLAAGASSTTGIYVRTGGNLITEEGASLSVSTQGAGSYGIFGDTNSTTTLDGTTTVTTTGDSADGVVANGGGSITTGSGSDLNVTTQGASAYGIFSVGSVAISGNAEVQTAGSGADGILAYSGGQLTTASASTVTVNTSGDSTYGIWSYGTGSLVDLSGPTSVTTTGSNSHGVFAYSGGTVTTESGSDLTVNTSTDDSYGIWASASTVTLGGTAEVTTAGNGAYGVVASSGGVITSNDDLTVSTTGATDASGSGSYGIFATGTSSQIILNGSANQITTTGSTSYGVYAYNGGQVTTGTASNATINTSGDYADGINSFGTDSQVILNGATTVTTQGLGAAGVIASTGGGSGTTSVTANGTIQITTTGDYSDGIDSEWSGSQVTLNGAATVATQGYEAVGVSADEGIITANNNLQVSTTGDNAYGLYAADGGTLDVATSGLTVSTTGASAVGALLYGIGSVMDLNGGTITTTGTEASGFMTFAGAAKTFDGTTNNILPTITVYGNDSAVLEASGTDSVTGDPSSITVAGSTALNMAETAGANTWGARAVNGGIITFADTSSTGGTALWANGGTIALAESGDASGSNVQIDTNGILDVIQASGNANIGSLSSPVADTTTGALDTTGVVNLGTNTLTIGNNNSTSNGSLIDDANFAGTINGTGNLVKTGTLTQILSGNNTYTGTTTVSGGALYIDGDQTAATGATTVASGATLGGTGTVGGNVTIANGGTLDPGGADGSIGTLTINGNLALNSTSNLNYNFGAAGTPGGTLNDLTVVNGDLTLGGTLNVTQAPDGSFDPGVYRVISYTGALTDNGLVLGTMPAGSTEVVQTSVPGQVNLVNITGTTLNFWDGDAGPKGDGVVNGGNGTWNVSNNNWTTSDGTLNAPYTNGSFAIFEGTPGTVTVDNTNGQVISGGMQFVTSGYTITGGSVELADGANIIRVGDGTTAGAGYTATIVSDLTGSGGINKTDAGTLILTGANSYTGGTTISGGTIQISADNDLGDLSGTLSFNGGTLNTTGTFSSERTTTINANGGTFNVNDATTFTMDGNVAGQGSLTKTGTGELLLSGQTLWTGGTTINAGTLTLNGNHGGAQLTGVITGQAGTTLNIDNGATWNLTGNSTLGNLNGNNGNLGINTNIAAGTNNHITADTANGNIAITVANTGGTITGKAPTLELIQVNNPNASNGNYTLSNGPIPVGLYNYNLLSGQQLNMGASNSANWYLSPSYGKELTTLLGASDQTGTWLMTNDSLLQRMGELRTSSTDEQKHSYQTWVRGYGWQANVNTTNSQVGYKENTYGVDLGADRVWQTPGWKIYTGIMLGYTNSQRTMTGGAGKSTADTVYGGIYGTWINDKGYYIDALAKIGSIHNSIKAYDTENSSASYSNLGLTASLEVGKQFKTETGWYVEPQVQGTVLNFTGAGFTTSGNAASILQKGNISYDLRAGAVAGKNIKTERGSIQPYVKAMYGQSWTNRGGISYNGDTMAANTGGNRYQVGGGVAWQIAQSTELHVDYEYIKGSRIEVPWKFNAGVRYNW